MLEKKESRRGAVHLMLEKKESRREAVHLMLEKKESRPEAVRLLLEEKESCPEAVRRLLLNGVGWRARGTGPLSAFVARLTFAAPHYHPIPLYMDEPKMILRTEDLVKKYKTRTVVNHVSINVEQGEIVGLLGPNGAGKTTTFYMTVTPNQGRIFLDETEITDYPVYKRARLGIGYLAQEASIFRKMTVEDNIRAVLEMTDRPKDYQQAKTESLIEEFGLQKVRKNLGDRLSGGERRRAEIARCLAIDPKFIMLDEPFAGVDPIAVQDIQTIVARLKHKNIGILITDHNVHETLSITDRAYLLFEGKVLFQGTAEELAANEIVREKYLGRDFELRKKNL